MSVIEDVRKAMQDFLAPQLQSTNVRLDGIEKRLDRIEGQIARMEEKFDALRSQIADDVRLRVDTLRVDLTRGVDQIVTAFQVNQRLEQLEHRQKQLESKQ